MMKWFKLQKRQGNFIQGIDLGQVPKIEITIEEEVEREYKVLTNRIIREKVIKNKHVQ